MKLGPKAITALLQTAEQRDMYIEGNILKLLEDEGSEEFKQYIETAIRRDQDNRRKRLEITKQIQAQNAQLSEAHAKNTQLIEGAKAAATAAKNAQTNAENRLDLMQKRNQFELMGSIVRVALWVIMGVGLFTTALYAIAMFTGREVETLGNAWTSMFGILLTNSFSIIGTVMGVKYAAEKPKDSDNS